MSEYFSKLLTQPYWIVSLLLGTILVALPCVTIDGAHHWSPHTPITYLPVWIGVALLAVSAVAFGADSIHGWRADRSAGIDLTSVKEEHGALFTCVGNCEVRVVTGRLEEQPQVQNQAVVLPCNEYFDDECAYDPRSVLGAYVNRIFEGQAEAFVALAKEECGKKLGLGREQRKTEEKLGMSFGAGRCVMLSQPLGRRVSVALVSTTTQRAGEGLTSRISYLFDALRELVSNLADARLNEVVMPVLGGGHGGIHPPLALVGLLLAISEAARYGPGAQRLKKVTVVVFRSGDKPPEVDALVIRRALALIGSSTA